MQNVHFETFLSMCPIGTRVTLAALFGLVALLGTLPSLAAHAAGPVTPGAGSILQQVQPVTPPAAVTDSKQKRKK